MAKFANIGAKTTRGKPRCKAKPEKRVDGIAPSTHSGDLITADYKILDVEIESRCEHNALIVLDEFTNWIQSHPMKTGDTSETMSFSRTFLSHFHKSGKQLTRTIFMI